MDWTTPECAMRSARVICNTVEGTGSRHQPGAVELGRSTGINGNRERMNFLRADSAVEQVFDRTACVSSRVPAGMGPGEKRRRPFCRGVPGRIDHHVQSGAVQCVSRDRVASLWGQCFARSISPEPVDLQADFSALLSLYPLPSRRLPSPLYSSRRCFIVRFRVMRGSRRSQERG